jgi:hypothetical protein
MPWRCPACRSEITHNPLDRRPPKGEQFRCHVCRLTLEFDPALDKLVIAPFETDHEVASPRRAPAKRIPLPQKRAKKPPRK